jgi:hypothetical protein
MNPNKIHRLKHYREFFASIPDERWCVDNYEGDYGQKCASGHLGTSAHEGITQEAGELNEMLRVLTPYRLHPNPGKPVDDIIVCINDDHWGYESQIDNLGSLPKERILKAIELCLKMESEKDVTSP